MEAIIIISLLCLIALSCYFAWKYRQLQSKHYDLVIMQGNIEDKERQLQDAEIAYEKERQKFLQMQSQVAEYGEEKVRAETEINNLRFAQQELNNTLNTTRDQVAAQLELLDSYTQQFDSVRQMHDDRCKKYEEETNARMRAIEQDCMREINDKRLAAQAIVDQFKNDAENERKKYLSIVETIQKALPQEEKDLNRHIQVNNYDREDMSYLLNNVAPHLNDSDILYKLIWSEFVQRPTNDMLDYILPSKDCPGIYKITNDRNQKSYIGRSTSVRKRLTDHIKSAVGISTIADQRIHQVMREEGLWNFSFELIEECEKEQLSEREKYYIDFFQTAEITYGYNQKAGG